MSFRKPILIFLWAILFVLPLHAAGHSCGPQPGNESLYALSRDPAFNECSPWQPCWPGYLSRLEAGVRKSPDDIVIGSMYLDKVQRLGPEKANAIRAAYVARGKRGTTNPAAQYLAGVGSVRGDEALGFFVRAVKLDPRLGRAYLQIAQRVFQVRPSQDQKDLEKRFGTAEENLGKFIEHCPNQPALALQFTEVGDSAFWKVYLSRGRELIEHHELRRSTTRYADALTSLWALEARLLPPSEAKARLASDLRLLENLGTHQGRSFPLLDALAAGRHKLSDFQGEEVLRDEILKHFPCSASGGNSAMRIRSDRFWLAHGGRKSPLSMTPEEARTYYATVRGWIQVCPSRADTYVSSLISVVYRLGVDGRLTPAELAREERFIKGRWERMRPYSGSYAPQSVDYIFAMIRLRTGKVPTPGDVLSLRRIERDMARWRTNTLMTGWLADSLPKDQELSRIGDAVLDVQVASVLARVLAARGDTAEASKVLGGLRQKVELLKRELANKEAYGVTTALAHYWRARGETASGWDRYGFLKLADVLQPSEGIDHDASLPKEIGQLADTLGIQDNPLTSWRGGSQGREALAQAGKLATKETEAVKNNVWRDLKAPLALPATTLKDLGGKTTTLAKLSEGRAILVNFWATWCGPCQLELPLLTKVAQEAGLGSIVTVSVDSDQGEVEPYLAKRKLHLPIVLLGEKMFRDLVQDSGFKQELEWAVPQSWIVRDGKIVSVITGFDGKVPPDKWVKDTLDFLREASGK